MSRAALAFMMFLLLAGCGRQEPVQRLQGFAQGTTWNISVWAPGGVDTTTLQRRINAEFARLDVRLSNYRSDSEIETFNAHRAVDTAVVGDEIVSLIETARIVGNASSGCYDLTIKPLFDLWGFRGDQLTPPDPDALARTLAVTGMDKIEPLPPDRLRKRLDATQVDLSSIAQGYSVGRIAAVLEAVGILNYLVEIGGELQTRGHKPDGSYWRIGIERPLPGGRKVQKALSIGQDATTAVMTSGTYRHYFDAEGKRYSHVLDARTGKPVDHDTVSVTVVADDPTWADAWSTALLCLGHEAGVRVADNAGIAALFISLSNDELAEHTTATWRSLNGMEVE